MELEKHITDERTRISYTLCGDYYLPDLKLPEEKFYDLGRFGRAKFRHLQKCRKAVLDRIEAVGAKRRKGSMVMQDCFVGCTPDWLKGKTVEEQREYFNYAYRFFEDSFGIENII